MYQVQRQDLHAAGALRASLDSGDGHYSGPGWGPAYPPAVHDAAAVMAAGVGEGDGEGGRAPRPLSPPTRYRHRSYFTSFTRFPAAAALPDP